LHRSATGATNRDIPIVDSSDPESTVDHFRLGRSLLHLPLLGLIDRDAKSYLNVSSIR